MGMLTTDQARYTTLYIISTRICSCYISIMLVAKGVTFTCISHENRAKYKLNMYYYETKYENHDGPEKG